MYALTPALYQRERELISALRKTHPKKPTRPDTRYQAESLCLSEPRAFL